MNRTQSIAMAGLLGMLGASGASADDALLEEAYNASYYADDPAAMQAILKRGFDVNARHGQQNTMLMYAVAQGNLKVAKVLVDAGADVEARNEVGHTALRSVVWTGEKPVEGTKFLIDAGADVNALDDGNWSPLIQASYDMDGNAVPMGKLLLAAGADPKVVNNEGNTALNVVASRGHVELVPLLLKAGADGNALGGDGESPLYAAVDDGNIELLKALLAGGVNPDIGDDDGKSPLIHAAMRGKVEMVDLLVAACADKDLRDNFFQKTAEELANDPAVKAALSKPAPASCSRRG